MAGYREFHRATWSLARRRGGLSLRNLRPDRCLLAQPSEKVLYLFLAPRAQMNFYVVELIASRVMMYMHVIVPHHGSTCCCVCLGVNDVHMLLHHIISFTA